MTTFFAFVSDLGHGSLYVLTCFSCFLMAFFLLGRHSKISLKATWYITTFWTWGVLLNTGLKFFILAPRPWYVHMGLSPLHPSPSGGYGMPSGHTQSAVGVYLLCWSISHLFDGLKHQRLWKASLRGCGLVWVILIALSRVYLHAHSFQQVLAGACSGFALMSFIIWIDKQVKATIYGLSLLLIGLSSCIYRFIYPYRVPQAWLDRSQEFAVSIPQAPSILLITTSFILSLACLLVRDQFTNDGRSERRY